MDRMMIAASLFAFAVAAGPAAAQTPAPAPAAPAGPAHVVTYMEFADDFVNRGGALLTDYRGKSLREAGNSNVEVFAEIGQPNRFAIVEMWMTAAAQETHDKASGAAPRADWLKQGALAPADVRMHKRWNVAGAMAPNAKAVYAITHVDVPPPRQAELESIMKPLAEKSRTEAGFLRFDILQSPVRLNHFTFVEGWESTEAAQAHATAAHTREFRDKLHPMLGALYDQRLYRFMP